MCSARRKCKAKVPGLWPLAEICSVRQKWKAKVPGLWPLAEFVRFAKIAMQRYRGNGPWLNFPVCKHGRQ
eukprot:641566-Lingulodinium_polyedra.AAC.1